MQWSRCPSLSQCFDWRFDSGLGKTQTHHWQRKAENTDDDQKKKKSFKNGTREVENTDINYTQTKILTQAPSYIFWGTYRWDPAPPELTLSASVVAAEARDRLEPDWALLRLSATEHQNIDSILV
jgi:hypothetical protein